MSAAGGVGDQNEAQKLAEKLGKTLKEGERILGPTRRPDGSLRKPIRIRAGYTPQDEVAIYQSKGALMRKEEESQSGPPGYDPAMDEKPKSKSAKRNERKKDKKLQANSSVQTMETEKEEEEYSEDLAIKSESVESIASRMSQLDVSRPSSESVEGSNSADAGPDIDKKIRALKKKIRLTEAQQQKTSEQDMKPELLEKIRKLDTWRDEIKILEEKKAKLGES